MIAQSVRDAVFFNKEEIRTTQMNSLARYIEMIVDPTVEDFNRNPTSVRHAFLACVAVYHTIDRAAKNESRKPASLKDTWCQQSLEFRLIEIVAHHFKHVKSGDEARKMEPGSMRLSQALNLSELDEDVDVDVDVDVRSLYFLVRDAVKFVKAKAEQMQPV